MYVFVSLGQRPRAVVLWGVVVVCFVFKELSHCFPERLYLFSFSPAMYECSVFPHPHQYLVWPFSFQPFWYLTGHLLCIFLTLNGAEHLLTCLFATCLSSAVLRKWQHSAENTFCKDSVPLHWKTDHLQVRLLHRQVRCLDAEQPHVVWRTHIRLPQVVTQPPAGVPTLFSQGQSLLDNWGDENPIP